MSQAPRDPIKYDHPLLRKVQALERAVEERQRANDEMRATYEHNKATGVYSTRWLRDGAKAALANDTRLLNQTKERLDAARHEYEHRREQAEQARRAPYRHAQVGLTRWADRAMENLAETEQRAVDAVAFAEDLGVTIPLQKARNLAVTAEVVRALIERFIAEAEESFPPITSASDGQGGEHGRI